MVKALRQALKDVPSSIDKNERFKRVSALLGGSHTKRDCYDKYKELKAETKLKRSITTAVGTAAGGVTAVAEGPVAGPPDWCHRPLEAKKAAGDDSEVFKGNIDDFSRRPCSIVGAPEQQRLQQQQRQQSSSSSASRSKTSKPPDDTCSIFLVGGRADLAGGGGGGGGGGGVRPLRTMSPASHHAAAVAAVRDAAYLDVMEVQDIDVEDFCLDDELAEHHGMDSRWGSTHQQGDARGRGASTDRLGREVTETQANGVRELVFGDRAGSFNDAWREQGFYFCNVEGLRYGLVQAEGGPCGVLAVVQAFMLECMIFGDSGDASEELDWRNPKRSHRERLLVSAMSSIIWRAGNGHSAILAVEGEASALQRTSRYRPDGVTEKLQMLRAKSKSALDGLVRDNLHQFTEKKELVNLLLLGRAHSNVFDGQRVLSDGDGGAKRGTAEGEGGGGGGDRVVLQGAPCRGRVGFLTLFEAYKHVEVGEHLKTPESPVWVVCSESHYSVLFSLHRSVLSSAISTPTASTAATATIITATSNIDTNSTSTSTRMTPRSSSTADDGWRGDSSDLHPKETRVGTVGTNNNSSSRIGNNDSSDDGVGEKASVLLLSPGGAGERRRGRGGLEGGRGAGRGGGGGARAGEALERFDLEYYDALGQQDEVICLTVDPRLDGHGVSPPTAEDEANGALVPPLDLVIRTRWPGAAVDWNGTEPIL
eukprot:jgi/Undpi1/6480/HiC_scaffold_20.g08959.m1